MEDSYHSRGATQDRAKTWMLMEAQIKATNRQAEATERLAELLASIINPARTTAPFKADAFLRVGANVSQV
jgi:hypothetical protein